MSAQRILVVEDEPDIAEIVRHNLARAGYEVDVLGRGDTALAAIRSRPPDLVVLDLMLPGLDGLELCRMIKREPSLSDVSLIMLTARTDETDRVVGLELGADDYVSKPFSPRELVLRTQAVLRRRGQSVAQSGPGVIEHGGLRIDPERHEVTINERPLSLTATEFRLLAFLAERADRVQRRDTLLSEVWGYTEGVDSRTVDTHVRRLRRKLGTEADRIETLIGVGYRFKSQI